MTNQDDTDEIGERQKTEAGDPVADPTPEQSNEPEKADLSVVQLEQAPVDL